MDVVLALVQKCKQDRDVASIHEYLGSTNRRHNPLPAPLNQVLNAQQQVPGDGGAVRQMCYCHYHGVHCKFGDSCKHLHAAKGSAARRAFEQDPTEMERYNAWLEARKESQSTPSSPRAAPPAAAHAAAAKSPKKKVKKKKASGSGAAVNTAAKEAAELAPKLTGSTGSLSVTAPAVNVAEVYDFHPLMMWYCFCELETSAQSSNLVSSIQIGDEPIAYSNAWEGLASGAEPAVFMVTMEQERVCHVFQPRLLEAAEELRSCSPISAEIKDDTPCSKTEATLLMMGTGMLGWLAFTGRPARSQICTLAHFSAYG